jgi:TPR repeat protein
MPVTFWTGEPKPKQTHEAIAYKRLIELFKEQFDGAETPVFVLFDFSIGMDLDIAVFTTDALAVVELKECAAPFEGGENGAWVIKDGRVPPTELKGGRHGNPYQQINRYRYAMIEYLDKNATRFLSEQKARQTRFHHVAGIIAVSPALNPQSTLDLAHHPWLHVLGLEQVADRVDSLTSSMFCFTEQELHRLVSEVLRCRQSGGVPLSAPSPVEPDPPRPLDWQPIENSARDSQWFVPFKPAHGRTADFEAKAAAGDPAANLVLGFAYFNLSKGPADDQRALGHFRAALATGNLTARVYFWVMHLQGRADPGAAPVALAAALLQQAAEAGYGEAALWMGVACLKGFGFAVDPTAAAGWFRRASDLGWPEATYALGTMLINGTGIPQNPIEGIRLVLEAAERGYSAAQNEMAQRYLFGDGVPEQPPAAAFWFERAALNGVATANGMLGVLYENGRGVAQSEAKAVEWYRRGVDVDDPIAQCMFAHRLTNGNSPGIPKDVPQALELYRKSAEQGHPVSQSTLGSIYVFGIGVERNVALGRPWIERAVALGDADAEYVLAYMYEQGLGIEQNLPLAHQFYLSAASKGHEGAKGMIDRYNQHGTFRPSS